MPTRLDLVGDPSVADPPRGSAFSPPRRLPGCRTWDSFVRPRCGTNWSRWATRRCRRSGYRRWRPVIRSGSGLEQWTRHASRDCSGSWRTPSRRPNSPGAASTGIVARRPAATAVAHRVACARGLTGWGWTTTRTRKGNRYTHCPACDADLRVSPGGRRGRVRGVRERLQPAGDHAGRRQPVRDAAGAVSVAGPAPR